MKNPLLSTVRCGLALLFAVTAASADTFVAPSSVDYYTTNYAAGNAPAGIWLSNFRGLKTWRDILVSNYGDNTVGVGFCQDDGTFTPMTTYAVGMGPAGVFAADLNNDRFDDIIVANSGTNTVSVLLNLKNGSFGTVSNYTVGTIANPNPVSVFSADINGDGRNDIIVANQAENTVTVLNSTPSSTFATLTNMAVGTGPVFVWCANLRTNPLSYGDIITANTDGTITILTNRLGVFTLCTNITLFPGGDPQPSSLSAADLNGDGLLDIVAANYASNNISILIQQADGTFLHTVDYNVGTHPKSVLIRELNHDANLDLAVANEGSGDVYTFIGAGDGTFTSGAVVNLGGSSQPKAIAASNFNQDGMSDMAVACGGSNTVSVLLYDLPLVFNKSVAGFEDRSQLIALKAQEIFDPTLTCSIVSGPSHGSLVLQSNGTNYTYTPSADYYGADSFTFKVNDGRFDSAAATVSINLLPVNDAPSFTFSTNVIVATKYAVLTYSNFVTNISVGPANESAQKPAFISTFSNPSIFSTRPVISPAGTLTFKPSSTSFGNCTVTVICQDNGGVAYSGTNRSPSQTFTIQNPGPNPFTSTAGLYNGLFSETGNVTLASAGAFNFTLSNIGAFSGRLLMGGKTYAFRGQCDTSGYGQAVITNVSPNLTVTLQVDVTGGSDTVTGTVANGVWTSTLKGDRATFNPFTNPAGLAGRYTMVVPGLQSSTTVPAGDGYGAVTISASGVITLSGYLADGTAMVQSSYISKNGDWPLYISLYGGQGLILSWINFTNASTFSFIGTAEWVKTGAAGGTYYSGGFTNEVYPHGSTYTVPAAGTRVLNITNGTVVLSDGDIPGLVTANVTLTTNNSITVTSSTNSFNMKIGPSLGTVSGSFRHPVTHAVMYYKGVVLQQENSIGGYFLGPTESGHIGLQ